jgi:membrane protease YdiL (CAAX protease family)
MVVRIYLIQAAILWVCALIVRYFSKTYPNPNAPFAASFTRSIACAYLLVVASATAYTFWQLGGSFSAGETRELIFTTNQDNYFVFAMAGDAALACVLLLTCRGSRLSLRDLGVKAPTLSYGLAVFIGLVSLGLVVAMRSLLIPESVGHYRNPQNWNDSVFKVQGTIQFIWVIWIVGVVPCTEELMFRGLLRLKFGAAMGRSAAVFLQACAFSAMHVDPGQFWVMLLIGLTLGCLMELTGSIVGPLFVHAMANAFALI